MFLSKSEFVEALKRGNIPFRQSSDATKSLSGRMDDFRYCPFCGREIFSRELSLERLLDKGARAKLKHVEIEPAICNGEFSSALVLECRGCGNTIWRHFSITEI